MKNSLPKAILFTFAVIGICGCLFKVKEEYLNLTLTELNNEQIEKWNEHKPDNFSYQRLVYDNNGGSATSTCSTWVDSSKCELSSGLIYNANLIDSNFYYVFIRNDEGKNLYRLKYNDPTYYAYIKEELKLTLTYNKKYEFLEKIEHHNPSTEYIYTMEIADFEAFSN